MYIQSVELYDKTARSVYLPVWMLEYEWAGAPKRAYVGGVVRTDGGVVVAGDSHYDNKKMTMVGGGVGLVLGGIGFALAAPPAKMMALPMIPVVSVHTPSDTAAQSACQYCTVPSSVDNAWSSANASPMQPNL